MKQTTVFLLLIMLFAQCTTQQSTKETAQWRGPDRNGIYPETNLLQEWPEEGPALAWKYNELGAGYASVAVADDIVYTSGTIDSIGYLFAFDVETGEVQWKYETGGWAWATPRVTEDTVYIGSISACPYYMPGIDLVRGLHAVDRQTGEKRWHIQTEEVEDYITGGVFATPLSVCHLLFSASIDGNLYAYWTF